MCLVATTRKLGISFFEYIRDRISPVKNIPCLATFFTRNMLLILLVAHGCVNNFFPDVFRGHPFLLYKHYLLFFLSFISFLYFTVFFQYMSH
jgi:hypothetical protein